MGLDHDLVTLAAFVMLICSTGPIPELKRRRGVDMVPVAKNDFTALLNVNDPSLIALVHNFDASDC